MLECKTEYEYKNKYAKNAGFKGYAERFREWRHKTGTNLPLNLNKGCPSWFGEFTENLMIHRYPGAKKMPYGNPRFDYLWNGINIDNKGRCLQHVYCRSQRWQFDIGWNNIAKKFILSGRGNRENMNPLVAFEFDKNHLVRIGKGGRARKVEFWKRDSFTITNTAEGLEQLENFQVDIDWLKDLSKELKEKQEK